LPPTPKPTHERTGSDNTSLRLARVIGADHADPGRNPRPVHDRFTPLQPRPGKIVYLIARDARTFGPVEIGAALGSDIWNTPAPLPCRLGQGRAPTGRCPQKI
jgi:hypothetical protein